MLTPEIQQYVSQQRLAGVSDEQIRQNLSSQGWSEADISSALQTNLPRKSHKSLWILVIILLVILIGSGIIYILYFHGSCCTKPTDNLVQATQIPVTSGSNTQGQKLCGNWPSTSKDRDYLDAAKLFSKTDSSTTINGVAVYPNVTRLVQTATGDPTTELLVACAKATSLASITDYYKKMPSYTVADAASLPAAYSTNMKFVDLLPQKFVDNKSGFLSIYNVGGEDWLLVYTHH